MDIAALSVGMSQVQFQQNASIEVMKMAMDTVKDQGNMVTELLESSTAGLAQPHIGGNLDIRV
ncbi:MAG TPA: YjfB family protein [Bacillota bacterium]|nr:YjfB family protein [Bacillota bacterium]